MRISNLACSQHPNQSWCQLKPYEIIIKANIFIHDTDSISHEIAPSQKIHLHSTPKLGFQYRKLREFFRRTVEVAVWSSTTSPRYRKAPWEPRQRTARALQQPRRAQIATNFVQRGRVLGLGAVEFSLLLQLSLTAIIRFATG